MPTASQIYNRAKGTDSKIAQDQAQLLADQAEGTVEHQELYDVVAAYPGPVVEVDPDQVHAMILVNDPNTPGRTITTAAFVSTAPPPSQPGTGSPPPPQPPTGTGMPPAPPTDAGTPPAPPTPDTGTQTPPQPPTDTTATPPDTGTPDTGTPDTGTPDTGTPDTGTPDTGTTPTPDTGAPDTGTTPPDQPTDPGTMPAGGPRPAPRR